MNKTLNEIQSELKVWTEYNFGKQTPDIPILGMIEELGELSHAILKEKQGIRQSDFLADKKDAISDLTIYALNYLNSIDVTINRLPIKTNLNKDRFYFKTESHLILILNKQISKLCTYKINIPNSRLVIDNVKILFKYLEKYCKYLDIDFLTTVNEVWEQVKLRDWKKYPKDGKTE